MHAFALRESYGFSGAESKVLVIGILSTTGRVAYHNECTHSHYENPTDSLVLNQKCLSLVSFGLYDDKRTAFVVSVRQVCPLFSHFFRSVRIEADGYDKLITS